MAVDQAFASGKETAVPTLAPMLNTTTSSGPTSRSIRPTRAIISSSDRASTPNAWAWPPSARMAGGEAAAIRFAVPEARDVTFEDIVRGAVTFNTAVIGDPVILRGITFKQTWQPIRTSVKDITIVNIPSQRSANWGAIANSIFVYEMGSLCLAHLGNIGHLLTDEQVSTMILGMLPERLRSELQSANEIDFSFTFGQSHRFRGNVFLQRGAHDIFNRAVVAEMDHLDAGGLQDAPHDVDRRVMPIE